MKTHKNIYIIGILAFFAFASLAYAKTLLIPLELLEGAQNLGYDQIDNYYADRPGPVDPAYVYGAMPGDKELSAVFWAINPKDEKQYALILMEKKNFLEKGKFSIIYKTQDFPRGLSTNKVGNIDLEYFHYVEDLNLNGKGKKLDTGIVIYDQYDGVGSEFCFKDGKWLITQYD